MLKGIIINTYTTQCRVRKKRKQMKTMQSLHRNCKSIAQVGGFMPSNWLAINSELSYDRTPELCPGSAEIMS